MQYVQHQYRVYEYSPSKNGGYYSGSWSSYQTYAQEVLNIVMTFEFNTKLATITYPTALSSNSYSTSLKITSTIVLPGPKAFRSVQSFTIEFWFRWFTAGSSQLGVVTHCPTSATCANYFGVAIKSSNVLQIQVAGTFYDFTFGAINLWTAGAWHYVGASFNSDFNGLSQGFYSALVDSTYMTAFASNNLNPQFGPNLYLAQGSSFAIFLKEVRVWAPMRAQHDLLFYQNTDLTKYYPANLWAYWRMTQDYMDYYKLVDVSPNGFGRRETANGNNLWSSVSGLTLCAFGKASGSSCNTEGTETVTFRNLPTTGETNRQFYFLSTTDDYFVGLWIKATSTNPNYAEFPSCVDPPCKLYANTSTTVKTLNYTDNSTGEILDAAWRNHSASAWHFFNFDVRFAYIRIIVDKFFFYDVATLNTTRDIVMFKDLYFGGVAKEIRIYMNYQADYEGFLYMINKNYRAYITNPTEYPYLVQYFRMTGTIATTYNLFDLSNYATPSTTILDMTSILAFPTQTITSVSDILFCRNGGYYDGVQCRYDHLSLTLSQNYGPGSVANIGTHYDLDYSTVWTVMFWFSHQIDGTTETIVASNTTLFQFVSVRNDAGTSSQGNLKVCGTTQTLYSAGSITQLGEKWQLCSQLLGITCLQVQQVDQARRR